VKTDQASNLESFEAGDRVIYTRFRQRAISEMPATYVRSQVTSGRVMHVICVDGTHAPRQVGSESIRKAQ
jgi:hypothetical protein